MTREVMHRLDPVAIPVAFALALALGVGCDPNRDLATYTCGNGVCDSGETPSTCATDCQANTCGNNVCEVSEDGATCPEDCAPTVCGDGVCEAGEDNACVQDCFADLCGNGVCDYSETATYCPLDCTAFANVDILFVIDNSGSMAGEQATLRANFPDLYATMRSAVGQLPNLHVGVTSTDLGTGAFQIPACEDVGGDGGDLLAAPSAGLQGVPWMVDLAPEGCDVTRLTDGTCTAHQCDVSNCPVEPGASLQLVVDGQSGCPRCRNFDQSAESTFQALGDLGTTGCGFEQPLEAMYKALDGNAANAGFVRPNSLLAVVIVSDEDDCSASTPQLFDTTQTDLDSTLGPLTSFRCFEFGITCDINSRTHLGTRVNCQPRDDSAALLTPIHRYTNLLYSLKDPGEIVLAAIAGPLTPSDSQIGGYDVMVGLSNTSFPELQYSCTTAIDGAVPGIRLRNLVGQFAAADEVDVRNYHSICSADYTSALQSVGDYIRSRLGQ